MTKYFQGQGAPYILGQFIFRLLECFFVYQCQNLLPGRVHSLVLKPALVTRQVTPQDTANSFFPTDNSICTEFHESLLLSTKKLVSFLPSSVLER